MSAILMLLLTIGMSGPAIALQRYFPIPHDPTNKEPLGTAACNSHLMTSGHYKFLSNSSTRILAQTNHGDRSRLYAAMQRFRAGGNLTVATIGGSITAGQGAYDAPAWPQWLEGILRLNLEDERYIRWCQGVHTSMLFGGMNCGCVARHLVIHPALDAVHKQHAACSDTCRSRGDGHA